MGSWIPQISQKLCVSSSPALSFARLLLQPLGLSFGSNGSPLGRHEEANDP
eukprot:NODE_3744_length_887_cov_37.786396_g3115_i0.p4 GENE.NODE_3744_length_887_cov_37.786396_g3115_i0~~NODE_3744_length_887_cov_37.786396_g3115_i0.p4  ORF type:complete len:51 (+),score=5.96 NODE_3744_length_887_cov_37.786396_g3115_i0:675-827(+)